jgi:hypothetical protein
MLIFYGIECFSNWNNPRGSCFNQFEYTIVWLLFFFGLIYLFVVSIVGADYIFARDKRVVVMSKEERDLVQMIV